MCLYPRLITNPKYKPNKKNKGVVPEVKDDRILKVPIGCGQCMECRKQKANGWKVRLNEEIRNWKKGEKWFITLTFSEEALTKLDAEIEPEFTGYERDNEIATIAVRLWTERWRKTEKKALRHWIITELGQEQTERIHLHGLIFTKDIQKAIKLWQYGNVIIGNGHGVHYVNETTIGYIVKYMTKVDQKHSTYKQKMLVSKGIGATYIQREGARHKYKEGQTRESYKNRQGNTMGLPMYYRNKVYTDEQKEALWIEKLDKNERWVDGQRITNADSRTEAYEKLREIARIKNKRLGYGELETWGQLEYERGLRDIKAERYRQIDMKKKLDQSEK